MPTQPMPAQHELPSEPGRAVHKPRRRLWTVAWLSLVAVAIVSVVAWSRKDAARDAQGKAGESGVGTGARAGERGGRDGGAGPGGAMQGKPPSVRVVELQPRPFEIVLEGLGTVTPLATVTVRSQVDGPLLSVAFQEGAAVKRGELLAQIDPRPYRIKLAQAKAATQRDQANLKNAQLDLERYTSLSEQKLIARQQLDAQQSMVDQLKASVAADEANADEAQLQLDYTRITSPIDGVAGIRQVDPGNLVHAADSSGIVVLTQLDPIAVVFTLPQDQLTPLSAAMAAGSPKVEIWSRDGEDHLSDGTLQVIDNQINVQTASIRLKARFANPQHKLWPNQFVRSRVTVSREAAALVLPAIAVQHGPQGAYVYVVSRDKNIAELRPIHIALLQGEDAVIDSGVKAGELIVTQGQAQVKPNSPVNPVTGNGGERGERGSGQAAGASKPRKDRGAAGSGGATP